MRGLLRRASWNLVDQVLSSGTNAVLSFVVARAVSDSAFGGFAVAFTVFSLLVGVSRAATTQPLGVRFSDAAPEEYARVSSMAAGSALVLGLVSGGGAVAVGLVIGGDVGRTLVALGIVLPGLLVQDAWRYVFFAAARPAMAVVNDACWAVLQLGAVAALLLGGVSTTAPLVLAWGGSAVAAAVLGARQARTRPRPGGAARWWREHLDLTRYLVAEYVTIQGAQQGTLLIIATIGSLEAIGSLRAVQVLLGPTTILAVAAFGFAIPEFARRRATMTTRTWMTAAGVMSSVVAGLGLCWGVLFVIAPDRLGEFLLGATWPGAAAILVPTIIAQFGAAMAAGPAAMLYAMDRARQTFLVNVVQAPLIVAGGVGGVLLAGARGASWGFAAGFWIVLPIIWWRLWRQARHAGPGTTSVPTDEVGAR